jgi:hypothetical protein
MWENVMWKNCAPMGDDEPQPEPGQGCILAHSMGLGKTLQVGALLHTMLTRLPKPAPKAPDGPHNAAQPADIRTALVIGPVNVLYNWYAADDVDAGRPSDSDARRAPGVCVPLSSLPHIRMALSSRGPFSQHAWACTQAQGASALVQPVPGVSEYIHVHRGPEYR